MMDSAFDRYALFRQRCHAGEKVAGTFQKTPSRHVGEILARSGLDFAVLDAEHAPFGIEAIDEVLAATHPRGFPVLVRVPELRSSLIGACLDAGASGIVIPHVMSAENAADAVAAARFSAGGRGLSPSGRAGDYGARTLADFMAASDEAVNVWCQIEDVEGVANIDSICRVPGVDALFVGRADLMRSLGASTIDDAAVEDAVSGIAAAGTAAGMRLAIHIGRVAEAERFAKLGFTIFICGSDQSLLGKGASDIRQGIDLLK